MHVHYDTHILDPETEALSKRNAPSCVASGLESDTFYLIKVIEVCNMLAASAYAARFKSKV